MGGGWPGWRLAAPPREGRASATSKYSLAPGWEGAYKAGVGGPRLVAAFVVIMTVAAGGWVLVRARRPPPADDGTVVAHHLPAVRRAADPFERWTITEQFAAQHAMVVQVETRHLDDALAIARQIALPLQSRYGEILVYFHRPGRPDTLPPRRVQWTPGGGFVALDLEAQ